jgi:hypothetical protein
MLHPQPIEDSRRVMQCLPIRALCTGFFAISPDDGKTFIDAIELGEEA